MTPTDPTPDPDLVAFAQKSRLVRAGETPVWTPLAGGVSSEVWKLESGGRVVCVKRALARLKVAADWTAPVARSLYEWRWFETVRALFPDRVPTPLAHDPKRGVFAVAYLAPADFPLWKAQLMAGHADPVFAAAVGDAIGAIHAATAGDAEVAARFPTDALFHALRLDPFLLAAAERRPEVGPELRALAKRTAGVRLALVHGDVSPKNILAGPLGPVFLDAETAWWGDPAFDLAFCLTHLSLKQLAAPAARPALRRCFADFAEAYLARVNWEPPAELERRAAALLPALLLARVDGKSPVEYLPAEAQKNLVRRAAERLLKSPAADLGEVAMTWAREVEAG
ncbi:MAG: phosphotransferase family protein [Caulobacterales bacterium]